MPRGPILDYLSIIRRGLQPKAASAKTVIIVGAGMAGLVAVYELLRAGHDPVILEAQQLVGGRGTNVERDKDTRPKSPVSG